MNHFEKEFRDRFKDAQSTDGVNPDSIWENISGALPDEDKPVVSWFQHSKYLILALLLFMGLGLGHYLSVEKKDEMDNVENTLGDPEHKLTAGKKEINADKNTATEKEDSINTISDRNTKNAIKEKNDLLVIKDEFFNKRKNKTNNSIENIVDEKGQINSVFGKEISENEIIGSLKEFENRIAVNIADGKNNNNSSASANPKSENEIILSNEAVNSQGKQTELFSQKNILLPTQYDELSFIVLNNDFSVDDNPVIPKQKRGRNRKINLGLFAGVVSWSNSYENSVRPNFDNELNQSNSSATGQSLSVLWQYKLTKKIHLTTGVEFINANTQFDYVSTKDSFAVVPDYEQLGPIDAIATRTVRHYNRQQLFSLPIMVGIHKNLGALEVGVDAGVGLNYIFSQKGKTLDEESVITNYDSAADGDLPYSNFFLSYQLQPYLNYAATERINLQLRPNFRYQQHGKSKLHQTNISSLLWGVNVGVMLGF